METSLSWRHLSSFAASLVRMEASMVALWNARSGQARLIINVLLVILSQIHTLLI